MTTDVLNYGITFIQNGFNSTNFIMFQDEIFFQFYLLSIPPNFHTPLQIELLLFFERKKFFIQNVLPRFELIIRSHLDSLNIPITPTLNFNPHTQPCLITPLLTRTTVHDSTLPYFTTPAMYIDAEGILCIEDDINNIPLHTIQLYSFPTDPIIPTKEQLNHALYYVQQGFVPVDRLFTERDEIYLRRLKQIPFQSLTELHKAQIGYLERKFDFFSNFFPFLYYCLTYPSDNDLKVVYINNNDQIDVVSDLRLIGEQGWEVILKKTFILPKCTNYTFKFPPNPPLDSQTDTQNHISADLHPKTPQNGINTGFNKTNHKKNTPNSPHFPQNYTNLKFNFSQQDINTARLFLQAGYTPSTFNLTPSEIRIARRLLLKKSKKRVHYYQLTYLTHKYLYTRYAFPSIVDYIKQCDEGSGNCHQDRSHERDEKGTLNQPSQKHPKISTKTTTTPQKLLKSHVKPPLVPVVFVNKAGTVFVYDNLSTVPIDELEKITFPLTDTTTLPYYVSTVGELYGPSIDGLDLDKGDVDDIFVAKDERIKNNNQNKENIEIDTTLRSPPPSSTSHVIPGDDLITLTRPRNRVYFSHEPSLGHIVSNLSHLNPQHSDETTNCETNSDEKIEPVEEDFVGQRVTKGELFFAEILLQRGYSPSLFGITNEEIDYYRQLLTQYKTHGQLSSIELTRLNYLEKKLIFLGILSDQNDLKKISSNSPQILIPRKDNTFLRKLSRYVTDIYQNNEDNIELDQIEGNFYKKLLKFQIVRTKNQIVDFQAPENVLIFLDQFNNLVSLPGSSIMSLPTMKSIRFPEYNDGSFGMGGNNDNGSKRQRKNGKKEQDNKNKKISTLNVGLNYDDDDDDDDDDGNKHHNDVYSPQLYQHSQPLRSNSSQSSNFSSSQIRKKNHQKSTTLPPTELLISQIQKFIICGYTPYNFPYTEKEHQYLEKLLSLPPSIRSPLQHEHILFFLDKHQFVFLTFPIVYNFILTHFSISNPGITIPAFINPMHLRDIHGSDGGGEKELEKELENGKKSGEKSGRKNNHQNNNNHIVYENTPTITNTSELNKNKIITDSSVYFNNYLPIESQIMPHNQQNKPHHNPSQHVLEIPTTDNFLHNNTHQNNNIHNNYQNNQNQNFSQIHFAQNSLHFPSNFNPTITQTTPSLHPQRPQSSSAVSPTQNQSNTATYGQNSINFVDFPQTAAIIPQIAPIAPINSPSQPPQIVNPSPIGMYDPAFGHTQQRYGFGNNIYELYGGGNGLNNGVGGQFGGQNFEQNNLGHFEPHFGHNFSNPNFNQNNNTKPHSNLDTNAKGFVPTPKNEHDEFR
jgi:hypothetical protein